VPTIPILPTDDAELIKLSEEQMRILMRRGDEK